MSRSYYAAIYVAVKKDDDKVKEIEQVAEYLKNSSTKFTDVFVFDNIPGKDFELKNIIDADVLTEVSNGSSN